MNDYNYSHKTEDSIFYLPKNTDIKITKTKKNGKKTEAPKLGYSQSSLEGFNNEEILTNNLGNFLTFQSFRGNYSLPRSNEYSNLYNDNNSNNIDIESNNLNLNLNNRESSNTNISKENDLENNDSLSLKSDNFSS